MIRTLLLLLAVLSFTVSAKNPHNPPPLTCPSAFGWSCPTTVQGSVGSYAPIVSLNATQIRVYPNTPDNNNDASTSGDLWLQVGSWSSVGSPSRVLDILDARDTWIRTHAVVRGTSGNYYALLYTGDGYPTQGGYSPSWATSQDGVTWTWNGPIGLFGRNQSSAAALVIDESRTDAYACMAWLDLAGGLILMHAPMPCDPAQWVSDGLNMWPIAGEQPQFVTAARTPYGYHLIGADRWDGTTNRKLRHMFSCDGLPPWRVLETESAVGVGTAKGTNLAYEATTNLIHALTSGQHFQMPAQAYLC